MLLLAHHAGNVDGLSGQRSEGGARGIEQNLESGGDDAAVAPVIIAVFIDRPSVANLKFGDGIRATQPYDNHRARGAMAANATFVWPSLAPRHHLTAAQLSSWTADGYLVIPDAVPPNLLKNAADAIRQFVGAGRRQQNFLV